MAIKKTTILCADVKMYTQESLMKVGQTRKGTLTMHDEDRLQFDEQLPQTCDRNPKIWAGRHFNVHKNRKGEYVVNFRHLVLTGSLDAYNFAHDVFLGIENAKQVLGL